MLNSCKGNRSLSIFKSNSQKEMCLWCAFLLLHVVCYRKILHNVTPKWVVVQCSKCCGQLWVWHMFYGVGLWWVIPPNKVHGLHWNTVWFPIDRMDLCQTHCKQVPVFSCAPASGQGHVGKSNQSQYTWLPPVPYLRVNMGCALAIAFQVRSLCVPTQDSPPFRVCFRESLVLMDYTQKSTRSTLAFKLSVAPPVYVWVTATILFPGDGTCEHLLTLHFYESG